jgi:hypothetical protein
MAQAAPNVHVLPKSAKSSIELPLEAYDKLARHSNRLIDMEEPIRDMAAMAELCEQAAMGVLTAAYEIEDRNADITITVQDALNLIYGFSTLAKCTRALDEFYRRPPSEDED